jgi:hypothetical protein
MAVERGWGKQKGRENSSRASRGQATQHACHLVGVVAIGHGLEHDARPELNAQAVISTTKRQLVE